MGEVKFKGEGALVLSESKAEARWAVFRASVWGRRKE